jgi:dihydropteroate synthase
MRWQTSRFSIDLSRPKVMGIVNVTPDSFSDGGAYANVREAMAHCEALLREGADILDIGGESTRPGAKPVGLDEELARVVPVLRHAVTLGVPVSVDTYKPAVMRVALDLGVDIINDVWALRWQGDAQGFTSSDVVSSHPHCGVCLMHMHRDPRTMQSMPMQGDVVPQVLSFLEGAAQALMARGVDRSRICVDPGIGFGKTVEQNFSLLARQAEALPSGYAVLAGWSRKSSLAAVTLTPDEQIAGMNTDLRRASSVAASLLAAQHGAHVLRVHDVRDTVSALKVLAAMRQQQ